MNPSKNSFPAVQHRAVRRSLAAAPLLALFAAAAFAAPARASYETATFSNVDPGQIVTITFSGNSATGWAGVYNFINGSGGLTGSFESFCIDVSQDIFAGQTVGFDKSSLANAPNDGNSNPGMGALRASLIAELWFKDRALIGTSDTNAAAFQIAIWKIINETQAADMTDVTQGSFTVSGPNATLKQANAWLSGIALDGSGPQAGGLIALTNPTYQDYVVQSVPAPPGMVLGASAAATLFLALVWRRRKLLSVAFGGSAHRGQN